jgi:hypothetical protein
MMSIATQMRDAYLAAELALLKGQSFRIGDRQLTRANLAEVAAERRNWERRANAEAAAAAGQGGPLSVHVSDFSSGSAQPGDPGQFGWHT